VLAITQTPINSGTTQLQIAAILEVEKLPATAEELLSCSPMGMGSLVLGL